MNLTDYIQKNAGHFNTEEPPEGHFEKMRFKIGNQKKQSFSNKIKFYSKAAIFLFMFTLSCLYTYDHFIKPNVAFSKQNLPEEVSEAQVYYTGLMQNKLAEIKNLGLDSTYLKHEIVDKELLEFEALYNSLKKDMENNPDNEKLLNALILHFQTKIEILNIMIEDLKKVKPLKPYTHESTQI